MGKRKRVTKGAGPSKRSRNIKVSSVDKSEVETEGGPTVQENVTEPIQPVAVNGGVVNKTEVHPLLIDHVLENVFQYLVGREIKRSNMDMTEKVEWKDLWNVRLVCVQWNAVATELLRRGRNPLEFGTKDGASSDLARTTEFLQTMENSNLIPVQRYSLGPHFFRNENKGLFIDFLRVCAPTAVELKLHIREISTMKFTRRRFPNLNLENLRKLVFINHAFTDHSHWNHQLTWLVEAFLQATKVLQEFCYEHFQFRTFPSLAQHTQWLTERIVTLLPKTVKILQLDISFTEAQLKMLMERGLKLEQANLNVRVVAGSEVLQLFLAQQSPSLRSLRCYGTYPVIFQPLEFPRMPRLTSLEILRLGVNPFSYQDTFPNLETLNLVECNKEGTIAHMLSPGKTSESIRVFHFPRLLSPTPMVARASRCFPNLRSVHLNIPKRTVPISKVLQETFIHFEGIEELCILYHSWFHPNVEPILGGVSEQDYTSILKNRHFDAIDIDQMRNQPSILNLSRLKKLTVDCLDGEAKFTDFAAHFIFLKMESLKELKANRFLMSSEYYNMLREKLTLKHTR